MISSPFWGDVKNENPPQQRDMNQKVGPAKFRNLTKRDLPLDIQSIQMFVGVTCLKCYSIPTNPPWNKKHALVIAQGSLSGGHFRGLGSSPQQIYLPILLMLLEIWRDPNHLGCIIAV